MSFINGVGVAVAFRRLSVVDNSLTLAVPPSPYHYGNHHGNSHTPNHQERDNDTCCNSATICTPTSIATHCVGISGAGISGAGISGAGISGAGISGAGISGAGISGAGISGARIRGVSGGIRWLCTKRDQ